MSRLKSDFTNEHCCEIYVTHVRSNVSWSAVRRSRLMAWKRSALKGHVWSSSENLAVSTQLLSCPCQLPLAISLNLRSALWQCLKFSRRALNESLSLHTHVTQKALQMKPISISEQGEDGRAWSSSWALWNVSEFQEVAVPMSDLMMFNFYFG